MAEAYEFRPPARSGLIFQIGLIMVLTALGAFGLWETSRAEVGPTFLLYLLPVLLAAIGVPLLGYRLQGMRVASYILERDGIRLRWGLRIEEIPMDRVLWVQDARSVEGPVPLPRLRWPGSVVGVRRLHDATQVEFMASEENSLVFIAVEGRIFGISPDNPEVFLETFRHFMELGCLTPIASRSVYPSFLLARFWEDRPARLLLLGGLGLELILLAWVSIAAPTRQFIVLRAAAAGNPAEQVPAVQLLLLPVLSTFFLAADLLLAMFFYRKDENRFLSYVLMANLLLTPLLFIGALFYILA